MKTYLPGSAHTGTTGFTNYLGQPPAPEEVWRDFPDAVIVDGSDDWYAPIWKRPEVLVARCEIEPLALFHTGISGISRSGVVLTAKDYQKLARWYSRTFVRDLAAHCRIYRKEK